MEREKLQDMGLEDNRTERSFTVAAAGMIAAKFVGGRLE